MVAWLPQAPPLPPTFGVREALLKPNVSIPDALAPDGNGSAALIELVGLVVV